MNRLKTNVALLLLALWAPISAHCLLESAGVLPEFLCCTADCAPDETGKTTDDDSCNSIESASYKTEDDCRVVVADLFAALIPEVLVSIEQVSPPFFRSHPIAVPELPVTWQFTFRAAAPPRAPSFLA